MGKKSHKKNKNTSTQASTAKRSISIRLSQCMITKNEERNIARALSWGKDIAFEQIVVDTGSTDQTVEIAEKMGAKVYHFEWINDFSAAKNYAIEQASGDWIAFLDADEYFSAGDAKKLLSILLQIENDPDLKKVNTGITCPLVNLGDNGQVFSTTTQQRIFRNVPQIRYKGRVHEALVNLSYPLFTAPDLSIIHTGYSATAYTETKKAERNVEIIRAELQEYPNNPNLLCYLADSLRACGGDDNEKLADNLYREALTYGSDLQSALRESAYRFLITAHYYAAEEKDEVFELCKKAYDEFRDNPDFCYYLGDKLFESGDAAAAWEKMIECEDLLKRPNLMSQSGNIISNPMLLFYRMVLIADALDKTTEVIRCATLVLKDSKYEHDLLAPYIAAFNKPGFITSTDELFKLLSRLYDFSNTRDKLTVMLAAKAARNTELVQKTLSILTDDELEWITKT